MDRLKQAALVLLIAAISLTAGTRIARAQSAEAEALFNEGDAKFKAGKLGEACAAFEDSNRLEPRAGTLIRLGECREKNKQLASAWSAYKDALTRVKDPKKKAIATAKVSELEPKLSYLTVSVSDANKIEGLALTRNGQPFDSALWNRSIPINGGEYVITAKAAGRVDWKTSVMVPYESGKVSVTVPKLDEPGKVTPTKPDIEPNGAKVEPQPDPITGPEPIDEGPTTSRWTGKRKIAAGLGGVAAGALVAGIVLGSKAKSTKDEAYALCTDLTTPCANADQANTLIDQAHRRATIANVLFGISGVAAIGAGVLWFVGAPKAASGVAIVPMRGGSAITVSGSF